MRAKHWVLDFGNRLWHPGLVPVIIVGMHQETLYNTATPKSFLSEYYEIAVMERPEGQPGEYMFIELHGWWDEEAKEPKHSVVTINPEEGMTLEEAQKMYATQREHRAQNGFIYSFSQNPFGDDGPRVIKI